MKKSILNIGFLLFAFLILNAQEKPCIQYERPKFSTGPPPKISPIFPGCENFKENNDSLNRCFGRKINILIAEKLDMETSFDTKIDSSMSIILKTKVILDIDQSGKLKMKLKERVHTEFENLLVLKLKELEEEITGIRPAEYEGGYCSSFRYQLPLLFAEEK